MFQQRFQFEKHRKDTFLPSRSYQYLTTKQKIAQTVKTSSEEFLLYNFSSPLLNLEKRNTDTAMAERNMVHHARTRVWGGGEPGSVVLNKRL